MKPENIAGLTVAEYLGYENVLMLLGLGGVLGIVFNRLGFPSVVGYLLAGIVYSFFIKREIADPLITTLGNLGIILLSFNIGLETRLEFFKKYAKEIVAVILMDFFITLVAWFFLGFLLQLELSQITLLTIITICASSGALYKMMIIGKGYTKEFRQLIFSMLALQDIIIIVALTIISSSGTGQISLGEVARLLATLTFFAIVSFYIGRKIISWLLGFAVKHNLDIYLIIVLSLVLGYSYISTLVGLSSLYGAFIAGMILASLSDPKEIMLRLQGLMELGILLYFSLVGAQVIGISMKFMLAGIIIALASIIVRSFSFTISAWSSGFKLKDSIKAGLLMTSISENGIILASAALAVGYFDSSMFSMVVVLVISSIVFSSSLYRNNEKIAEKIESMVPRQVSYVIENVITKYYTRASDIILKVSWSLLEGLSIIFVITVTVSFLESRLSLTEVPLVLRAFIIMLGLFLTLYTINYFVRKIVKEVMPIDTGIEEVELEDAAKIISFMMGALGTLAFVLISSRYSLSIFLEEFEMLGFSEKATVLVPVVLSIASLIYFVRKGLQTYKELKTFYEKEKT